MDKQTDIKSQKPWYLKWWGIILAFLFLPFFGIWYAWAKSNWDKWVKIIVTVVAGLFILAALASGENTPQTSQPRSNNQENQTEQPSTEEQAKPQTMLDKLWAALDQGVGTRNGYDIGYDNYLKETALTFYSSTFWNEDSLVEGSYTTLVKFGIEAFKIDGVDMLEVIYKTDFTDPYGNKSQDVAVRIVMGKENFNKFNWDNLKYSPVSRQIEVASEIYYIHPAVKKNLNEDKLYLSF